MPKVARLKLQRASFISEPSPTYPPLHYWVRDWACIPHCTQHDTALGYDVVCTILFTIRATWQQEYGTVALLQSEDVVPATPILGSTPSRIPTFHKQNPNKSFGDFGPSPISFHSTQTGSSRTRHIQQQYNPSCNQGYGTLVVTIR